MQMLTSAKKQSKRLKSGELLQYLKVPDHHYGELKQDFRLASHLKDIEHLDLDSAAGVLIKCQWLEDGMSAALYLLRKYEEEQRHQHPPLLDVGINDFNWPENGEFPIADVDIDDDELLFEVDEDVYSDEDDDDDDEVRSFIFNNARLRHIPVISDSEYAVGSGINHGGPVGWGFGVNQFRVAEDESKKKPYWTKGKYPLVIDNSSGMVNITREMIESSQRFLIIVKKERAHFENLADFIDNSEKDLLFSTNVELCQISEPEYRYYQGMMLQFAKDRGYRIASSVNQEQLIEELKRYRGFGFRSIVDIETIVDKAIRKKSGTAKTLTRKDFDTVFDVKTIAKKMLGNHQPNSAAKELEQLIGLEDVKMQIARLVKLMKFNQLRKQSGYRTSEIHNTFVFMGNPGTAKTTVARIFGKLLHDENVLMSGEFIEVSRKDLVGQYVGWTAPLVAKVFEQAHGGVLFIDEAYSLMTEGRSDGYSDEAIAEIIRQMENHPDTVVIFAGYEDKMRSFIQNANPGLRSRITSIVNFPDYAHIEMFEILRLLMGKEDYVLENESEQYQVLDQFLNEIEILQGSNIGNGRLMRKLMRQAVGFMSERNPEDMKTVKVEDLQKAVRELLNAEWAVSKGSNGHQQRIGFQAALGQSHRARTGNSN